MTIVIKRDGSKEKFKADKIRKGIENASKRTDIDKKRAKEIAERVAKRVADYFKNRDEVRSEEIRDRVLSELDREERKIANEFRAYRKV
ncbi:MAG: ATP cone domain-containing protein [Candidatus Aenigmatarchaeota archaeon]